MKTLSTACFIVIVSTVTSLAQIKQAPENTVKTYGNATVAKVIAVETAYTFRCDVEGWPDVIGSDIPIKINGIAEPVIVAEEGKPNRFFQMQAKKILSTHLSRSETISLHNIKRGTDFSLIADVVIDSNSLADILIENGFARRLTEDEIKKTNPITAFPRTLNALNANHQRPAGKNANNSNYLASKNSKVFHEPSCRFAKSMDEKTVLKFSTKEHAIRSGRRPCKVCGQ